MEQRYFELYIASMPTVFQIFQERQFSENYSKIGNFTNFKLKLQIGIRKITNLRAILRKMAVLKNLENGTCGFAFGGQYSLPLQFIMIKG